MHLSVASNNLFHQYSLCIISDLTFEEQVAVRQDTFNLLLEPHFIKKAFLTSVADTNNFLPLPNLDLK